jgi:hypothetical protein
MPSHTSSPPTALTVEVGTASVLREIISVQRYGSKKFAAAPAPHPGGEENLRFPYFSFGVLFRRESASNCIFATLR